jgi:preprotein translocase subunit SecD
LYTKTDRDQTALKRYTTSPGGTYVLLSDKPDEVLLSGSKRPRPWHLKQVQAIRDAEGRPAVELQFDETAAAGMARLTKANRGRALATLFFDHVVQIQVIDAEIRDKMVLSGKAFDEKLVKQLVRSLSECMLAENEPEQLRPKQR